MPGLKRINAWIEANYIEVNQLMPGLKQTIMKRINAWIEANYIEANQCLD